MNDAHSNVEHTEPRNAVEKRSVHEACRQKEAEHRWLESEKHQQDLGERAEHDWAKSYWYDFLRGCYVEHLEGKQYWIELDRGDFGILQKSRFEPVELFEPVLDMLKTGHENLTIICWAGQCGKLNDKLHHILTTLDLNRCHIPHRIDQTPL